MSCHGKGTDVMTKETKRQVRRRQEEKRTTQMKGMTGRDTRLENMTKLYNDFP